MTKATGNDSDWMLVSFTKLGNAERKKLVGDHWVYADVYWERDNKFGAQKRAWTVISKINVR